ncbi:hypothetical protein BJ138DRAFT_1150595 [Hygrophoropsis aurantiaca]|uniref:Uncharacterized protein n=1 Tax=Hygrophoropsis aurantiaca TaxID=72124 RepID=A0ACB8ADJ7_9AGAM|nr:hypothetical protein BJ138DRAFT_1150595 [Hygrophoropsis aurantiaca]
MQLTIASIATFVLLLASVQALPARERALWEREAGEKRDDDFAKFYDLAVEKRDDDAAKLYYISADKRDDDMAKLYYVSADKRDDDMAKLYYISDEETR